MKMALATRKQQHQALHAQELRTEELELGIRQAQLFAAPREELTQASQLLAALVPSTRSSDLFVCPVPGCSREDRHGQLSTHLLAEHFEITKVAAAVLARLEAECCKQDTCVLSPRHFKPLKSWKAHLRELHLHHAWAITLKLHTAHGLPPSPLAGPPAPSSCGPQDPLLLSAAGAMRRADDFAADTLRRTLAQAEQQARSRAAGAAYSAATLHRMLDIPCPHRCGAVLQGHAVAAHVLQHHLDTLLDWLQQDPHAVLTDTWTAVGLPSSRDAGVDERVAAMARGSVPYTSIAMLHGTARSTSGRKGTASGPNPWLPASSPPRDGSYPHGTSAAATSSSRPRMRPRPAADALPASPSLSLSADTLRGHMLTPPPRSAAPRLYDASRLSTSSTSPLHARRTPRSGGAADGSARSSSARRSQVTLALLGVRQQAARPGSSQGPTPTSNLRESSYLRPQLWRDWQQAAAPPSPVRFAWQAEEGRAEAAAAAAAVGSVDATTATAAAPQYLARLGAQLAAARPGTWPAGLGAVVSELGQVGRVLSDVRGTLDGLMHAMGGLTAAVAGGAGPAEQQQRGEPGPGAAAALRQRLLDMQTEVEGMTATLGSWQQGPSPDAEAARPAAQPTTATAAAAVAPHWGHGSQVEASFALATLSSWQGSEGTAAPGAQQQAGPEQAEHLGRHAPGAAAGQADQAASRVAGLHIDLAPQPEPSAPGLSSNASDGLSTVSSELDMHGVSQALEPDATISAMPRSSPRLLSTVSPPSGRYLSPHSSSRSSSSAGGEGPGVQAAAVRDAAAQHAGGPATRRVVDGGSHQPADPKGAAAAGYATPAVEHFAEPGGRRRSEEAGGGGSVASGELGISGRRGSGPDGSVGPGGQGSTESGGSAVQPLAGLDTMSEGPGSEASSPLASPPAVWAGGDGTMEFGEPLPLPDMGELRLLPPDGYRGGARAPGSSILTSPAQAAPPVGFTHMQLHRDEQPEALSSPSTPRTSVTSASAASSARFQKQGPGYGAAPLEGSVDDSGDEDTFATVPAPRQVPLTQAALLDGTMDFGLPLPLPLDDEPPERPPSPPHLLNLAPLAPVAFQGTQHLPTSQTAAAVNVLDSTLDFGQPLPLPGDAWNFPSLLQGGSAGGYMAPGQSQGARQGGQGASDLDAENSTSSASDRDYARAQLRGVAGGEAERRDRDSSVLFRPLYSASQSGAWGGLGGEEEGGKRNRESSALFKPSEAGARPGGEGAGAEQRQRDSSALFRPFEDAAQRRSGGGEAAGHRYSGTLDHQPSSSSSSGFGSAGGSAELQHVMELPVLAEAGQYRRFSPQASGNPLAPAAARQGAGSEDSDVQISSGQGEQAAHDPKVWQPHGLSTLGSSEGSGGQLMAELGGKQQAGHDPEVWQPHGSSTPGSSVPDGDDGRWQLQDAAGGAAGASAWQQGSGSGSSAGASSGFGAAAGASAPAGGVQRGAWDEGDDVLAQSVVPGPGSRQGVQPVQRGAWDDDDDVLAQSMAPARQQAQQASEGGRDSSSSGQHVGTGGREEQSSGDGDEEEEDDMGLVDKELAGAGRGGGAAGARGAVDDLDEDVMEFLDKELKTSGIWDASRPLALPNEASMDDDVMDFVSQELGLTPRAAAAPASALAASSGGGSLGSGDGDDEVMEFMGQELGLTPRAAPAPAARRGGSSEGSGEGDEVMEFMGQELGDQATLPRQQKQQKQAGKAWRDERSGSESDDASELVLEEEDGVKEGGRGHGQPGGRAQQGLQHQGLQQASGDERMGPAYSSGDSLSDGGRDVQSFRAPASARAAAAAEQRWNVQRQQGGASGGAAASGGGGGGAGAGAAVSGPGRLGSDESDFDVDDVMELLDEPPVRKQPQGMAPGSQGLGKVGAPAGGAGAAVVPGFQRAGGSAAGGGGGGHGGDEEEDFDIDADDILELLDEKPAVARGAGEERRVQGPAAAPVAQPRAAGWGGGAGIGLEPGKPQRGGAAAAAPAGRSGAALEDEDEDLLQELLLGM